ncbi:MAG: rRNA cytosine-C5-methylase, partial [Kiloniellales bacterium]|nr:rRNA cytosine-C5-methylase [Kiloniellales bacterium]
MTPAARIAAAIEILEQVEAAEAPADKTVTAYLRARRFIGAKDRRALGQRVFALLRARARLDWWCARAGLAAAQARHRVLAGLLLIDGES